jgi:hypothetical protein
MVARWSWFYSTACLGDDKKSSPDDSTSRSSTIHSVTSVDKVNDSSAANFGEGSLKGFESAQSSQRTGNFLETLGSL